MTLTTGQTSFISNIPSYIFVALCTSFSGYKEKLSLDINTLYQLFVRLHIILTPPTPQKSGSLLACTGGLGRGSFYASLYEIGISQNKSLDNFWQNWQKLAYIPTPSQK